MFFDTISVMCLIISIGLLVLFFVEKRKTRDRFDEGQTKIDNEIHSVHEMVNKNQSDTEKSIVNNASITNENSLKISLEVSKNREELEKTMMDDFGSINNQIGSLSSIIEKLNKENEQLRKKLEYFTEIGSDSKQLNESEDADEQKNILEKALIETRNNSRAIENGETNKDTSVLDEDQNSAYSIMENTNNNYFITGKAGTGKSFLLRLFEKGTKKKTLKVSPTGVSALNIGGATIHSTFGFYNVVNLNVEDINIKTIRLKSEKKIILRNVDTIIIDEISMVRADTFDKIDRILRAINNNDILFGGKQILAFGDLFQLPPIANFEEGNYLKEKYGGIFFFFSDAYKDGKFEFIELTTNHRQKQDMNFFEILNRMREGIITDEDIALVNKRVTVNEEDLRRVVRLFPKKDEAEKINKLELDKIPARELTYEAHVLFEKYKNQNINIESTFPITSSLKLKLGALVMMVVNDTDKRWVNGTLGIISFIKDDVIKVKINDIEYEVNKSVFESREAIFSKGRIDYEVVLQIEQYPVILAYAITIHKSQGMTYQRIACDITDCFAPGQAYVALSRCNSLNGIFLLNAITSAEVTVDSEVKKFYTSAKKI